MQKLLVCAVALGLVACGGDDDGTTTRVGPGGGTDLSMGPSVGKARVKITVAGQTFESSGTNECMSFNVAEFDVTFPGVSGVTAVSCYGSWDTGIVDVGAGPAITVSAIGGSSGIESSGKTIAYKSVAFAPSGMQVTEVDVAFLGSDF